jgi:transcriptional regulator with XRE-family HTH domain
MPSELRSLRNQFGRTVRIMRDSAKLTQMELAEKADLTLNYVGEIERGEKLASLETVLRLARAFGLRGHELLARAKL